MSERMVLITLGEYENLKKIADAELKKKTLFYHATYDEYIEVISHDKAIKELTKSNRLIAEKLEILRGLSKSDLLKWHRAQK